MLAIRDIRRKIRSVRNIQQICRAMKTISGIKLVRAEMRVNAARPYLEGLSAAVPAAAYEADHPLTRQRDVKTLGVILITGDKGLCGSYNINAIQAAMKEAPAGEFVALGRKGAEFLRRRGAIVRMSQAPLGAEPRLREAAALADAIAGLFLEERWDEVRLVYTAYRRGGRPRPQAVKFLPIAPGPPAFPVENVIFEPERSVVLNLLLPRYLHTVLYTAMLESIASEHASRVTAMALATDNAEKVINSLTREFNKARQDSITKELLDIVATAEAVR